MNAQRRTSEPLLLVVGLSLLGICCLTVAVWPPVGVPTSALPLSVPWLALALAFLVGDRVDISIDVRDHAIAVTPAHFVLVFGLFTVDPVTLISARVVGGALALALLRVERDTIKLTFNVALYLFEAASVTALVRVTPWWTGSALDARNWFTVFAGMAVYTAVALALILVAIRFTTPGGQPLLFGRTWAFTTLAETANAALGLVAVLLWQLAPWALLLLLPPAGVSYLAYVGFTRLNGRHQNLERLYDFTGKVSQADAIDEAIAVTLREAATVLHARQVELLLLADHQPLRWVQLGPGDTVLTPVAYPRWESDPLLARVVSSRQAVLRASVAVRARRRHGDAIAVPLLAGASLLGVLVVRGRSGNAKLFDRSDVTALSALANHAGMSVENLRLIAQLRNQADEREQLALHDALTGLGNRRLFNRCLNQALTVAPDAPDGADGADGAAAGELDLTDAGPTAAGGGKGSLAVLLVDLNGFKDVNDTLGHDAGDRLLQAVAHRLMTHAGPGTEVARLGGDEFAVLVSPCTVPEAELLARHLLEVVEEPLQLDGVQLVIGASIGLACAPEHASDEASLLQRADLALYAAKARPDASIEVYQPVHGELSARRLTMASDLRQALDRRSLEVRYQPQIDLLTNQVVATEALLRWHHPDLGDISPAEFVAVAEHLGLVDRLTRFVVEEAVAQAAQWRRDGLDLEMSINISVRNLLEPAFPDHLAATLAYHGVAAERVTLEITETELMHEAGRAEEMLTRLHDLGVGLSIDDFGTGYSSLAYLKRLPVSELKLDRSFVRDLARDASDAMIARTVIDLAGNLELRVVAEGIEDEEARAALLAMGCQRGQGFLLAQALPPGLLWQWAKDFGRAELISA